MQSVAVVVAQRSAGRAANVAVTLLSANIVSTQVKAVPLSAQSPPQPLKVCVASFQLAVSVTSESSACVVVPPGSTLPPPVAVTVTV